MGKNRLLIRFENWNIAGGAHKIGVGLCRVHPAALYTGGKDSKLISQSKVLEGGIKSERHFLIDTKSPKSDENKP